MGGTIWVESEQGVGSSFHFTMLQLWAPPEAPPPSAPPSEGGRSRQTSTDSAAERDHALPALDTPPATPQARKPLRSERPPEPSLNHLCLASKALHHLCRNVYYASPPSSTGDLTAICNAAFLTARSPAAGGRGPGSRRSAGGASATAWTGRGRRRLSARRCRDVRSSSTSRTGPLPRRHAWLPRLLPGHTTHCCAALIMRSYEHRVYEDRPT